ncbi:MAG: FmdB family zinc ribbon protein [Acidimicrobiales bacterium]
MPTYEYRCRDCGQHVEVVQSFKDPPLTSCGVCGGDLRKVFSPIGITFKGSGFYKTDSRSPSVSTSAAKSDGEKSEKSEKPEKGDKAEKGEKSEKGDKSEKKSDKAEKSTPSSSAGSEAKSA